MSNLLNPHVAVSNLVVLTLFFFFSFDSMFISVEDHTRRIRFPYNYSMSFTYSQMVITKQAGDTLYTRSYNLKTCMVEK